MNGTEPKKQMELNPRITFSKTSYLPCVAFLVDRQAPQRVSSVCVRVCVEDVCVCGGVVYVEPPSPHPTVRQVAARGLAS